MPINWPNPPTPSKHAAGRQNAPRLRRNLAAVTAEQVALGSRLDRPDYCCCLKSSSAADERRQIRLFALHRPAAAVKSVPDTRRPGRLHSILSQPLKLMIVSLRLPIFAAVTSDVVAEARVHVPVIAVARRIGTSRLLQPAAPPPRQVVSTDFECVLNCIVAWADAGRYRLQKKPVFQAGFVVHRHRSVSFHHSCRCRRSTACEFTCLQE